MNLEDRQVVVGQLVRVPGFGPATGLRRYGEVVLVVGQYVRVRLTYGCRVRVINTYTLAQLEEAAREPAQMRRAAAAQRARFFKNEWP